VTTLCVLAMCLVVAEPQTKTQSFVFDLSEPEKFQQSLPKSAIQPRSSRPLVASVEGPLNLKVVNEGKSETLKSSLVVIVEPISGRSFLQVESQPMAIDEAMRSSEGLLSVLAMEHAELRTWAADEAKTNRGFRRQVTHKGQSISLEIRRSLQDELPWVVSLAIGFDRKEQKAPDADK
jgi:hypothetical protein